MSYLNVPRLHFSGRFQADPSTVNNNDNNWDPTIAFTEKSPTYLPGDPDNTELYDNSVYWNPNGTHNWKLVECTVAGAANDGGVFTDSTKDAIIGASVKSVGKYPAKIVDLDPDNQAISQIWGLKICIAIVDPNEPGTSLASLTATLPATAFCDLWNRTTNVNQVNNGSMSASFQGLLKDLVWVNETASPLLTALRATTVGGQLSIRFTVDSYQSSANAESFMHGRLVGSIGPVLTGDAPRSTRRRLAPVQFWNAPPLIPSNMGTTPSIFGTFGAANAVWDSARSVVVIDLGNTVPTNGQGTLPRGGWPVDSAKFQLMIPGPSVSPFVPSQRIKTGGLTVECGTPAVLGTIEFTSATYLQQGGIVEVQVDSSLAPLLETQPLRLTDVTNGDSPAPALAEDPQGRYADVDNSFARLNPNDSQSVTLWATKFGQPWQGASLKVTVQPPAAANNNPGAPQPPPDAPPPQAGTEYATWQVGTPSGIVTLASSPVTTGSKGATTVQLTTGADGTATLQIAAGELGQPRMYRNGQLGPGGQVYFATGPWQDWGKIFLFSGAPINLLVFSSYQAPTAPTWEKDVGPILSLYARMYPYMKGIIDLSDYDTVVSNSAAIRAVLNLPPDNPHHMPVVRDLPAAKLRMINQWFAQGMPKSSTTQEIA